jgi:hypothetical protein
MIIEERGKGKRKRKEEREIVELKAEWKKSAESE